MIAVKSKAGEFDGMDRNTGSRIVIANTAHDLGLLLHFLNPHVYREGGLVFIRSED